MKSQDGPNLQTAVLAYSTIGLLLLMQCAQEEVGRSRFSVRRIDWTNAVRDILGGIRSSLRVLYYIENTSADQIPNRGLG
jgi:hypothetical protein